MFRNIKNYPITALLIGVCVIVFLYTTLFYGIDMNAYQGLQAGGMNPVYVIHFKQYYRLITANFIHFGLMHLFCNVYSLCNLGCVMELILEMKRYVLVIIISMLATTGIPCLLYLLNGTGMYSIMGGISGVIFGLIGSLCALALIYKDVYYNLFRQILSSLLLMLFISFAIPSISLVGHVSGFIGGFVTTILISKFCPLYKW